MVVRAPHVLLVNDDGPPSELYQHLVEMGWQVRVVLPSSRMCCYSHRQRNHGVAPITVSPKRIYYPLRDNFQGSHPDTQQCWSHERRPVRTERGEMGEWVLVDGTPSTCTNVGLFTGNELFQSDQPIDLVLSGPNFGRNTGTAFSVSSGTLGGALAGSLSGVRSIAISFCHFKTAPPTLDQREAPPLTKEEFAHYASIASRQSAHICAQLWQAWDQDAEVQAYSINVPICESLQRPEVHWTKVWQSQHVQLYPLPSMPDVPTRVEPLGVHPKENEDEDPCGPYLAFRPNLARAMCPADPKPGTDVWAIHRGHISVSRLMASFAEVDAGTRPVPSCI